jgi:hypothetical protein
MSHRTGGHPRSSASTGRLCDCGVAPNPYSTTGEKAKFGDLLVEFPSQGWVHSVPPCLRLPRRHRLHRSRRRGCPDHLHANLALPRYLVDLGCGLCDGWSRGQPTRLHSQGRPIVSSRHPSPPPLPGDSIARLKDKAPGLFLRYLACVCRSCAGKLDRSP